MVKRRCRIPFAGFRVKLGEMALEQATVLRFDALVAAAFPCRHAMAAQVIVWMFEFLSFRYKPSFKYRPLAAAYVARKAGLAAAFR